MGLLATTICGKVTADIHLRYRFDVRSEGPRRLLVGRRRVIVVRCKNLGVSYGCFFLASKVGYSKPFNKIFLRLFFMGDENSFFGADCQAVMMCALCATPKVFSLFQDSFLLR